MARTTQKAAGSAATPQHSGQKTIVQNLLKKGEKWTDRIRT
jgi:hypothetical protein